MVDINISTNTTIPYMPAVTGKTSDGRIIYETKDTVTGKVTKFSIPEENQDKFEKVVQEVQKKYGKYNTNPEKKVAQAAHLATLGGAIAGGALTASLIKTKSKTGRFFKTIGGALGGAAVAGIALAGAILYPFIKLSKELKNLGYKPLNEPAVEIKPEKKEPETEEKEQPKTEKQ